ncbi:MAG: hypothetical protein IJU86_00525 [Firmicutes bacterium]|nr:hypothetical protein [Bacillota bacterium]
MSEQFKTVQAALDYIAPFEKWKDYSSAFEKYIDENLETYKNQHTEEYKKIKDDVIKYLTGEGITEKETHKDGDKIYEHINVDVFNSLIDLSSAKVHKISDVLDPSASLKEEEFKGHLNDYKQTVESIKTGLKKKKFILAENEESIRNNADKIVRHLECFKLKFKDEFDNIYKKEKETEKIPKEKNSPDTNKFNFWNMIEANDFMEYLDDYINSKDRENHLLKKLFSFDYFPELSIKQLGLLDRIQKSKRFQQRQKEDQIKFFEHIGDFFDGTLANDAKQILQEKYNVGQKAIENKQNELLEKENSNHEDKNENVPSRKKFWIGILLLTVIIVVIGVFKPIAFAFLIVPIVFSIILLCKKPNKNEYRNLKIGNSYPITAGNDMDPNLLKDEDFADLKLKKAKNILNTK